MMYVLDSLVVSHLLLKCEVGGTCDACSLSVTEVVPVMHTHCHPFKCGGRRYLFLLRQREPCVSALSGGALPARASSEASLSRQFARWLVLHIVLSH